jgi:small nuclear ribonucleoprotein (snRNP)-like protein
MLPWKMEEYRAAQNYLKAAIAQMSTVVATLDSGKKVTGKLIAVSRNAMSIVLSPDGHNVKLIDIYSTKHIEVVNEEIQLGWLDEESPVWSKLKTMEKQRRIRSILVDDSIGTHNDAQFYSKNLGKEITIFVLAKSSRSMKNRAINREREKKITGIVRRVSKYGIVLLQDQKNKWHVIDSADVREMQDRQEAP